MFARQQIGPRRIEMHVVADGAQVAVAAAINHEGLVASAQEMAEEFVPPVEAAAVGAQKPFHAGHQIGQRGVEHQMKMIVHETIRMDLPGGFGASLGERSDEAAAVQVVLEDGFGAVAAVHDVVEGAGIFDAQFAGHAGRLRGYPRIVNVKTCDYAGLTPL